MKIAAAAKTKIEQGNEKESFFATCTHKTWCLIGRHSDMNTAQCLSMLGQQLHMLAAFPYGQKQSKLRTRMQSKENMTRLEHPLSFSFSSSRHNVQKSFLKVYSGSEQNSNTDC